MYDLAHAHEVWRVPARFGTCTPAQWAKRGRADYEMEWIVVRGWLAQFRRFLADSPFTHLRGHGLVLVGETGVGKTMLACSLLNYLRRKGFSTAFVRDGDLMRLVTARYLDDDDTDALACLQRPACIAIDDVGRSHQGDKSSVEILEPFLRYRMDEAKPTIVTMNSAVPLTTTLESLLHEFTFVPFAGPDRRISPLEPDHGRW